MADTQSTTLPTPIPTDLNVTALAERFKVARSTIRRRLKKGWVPPATASRKQRKAKANALARDLAAVPVNARVKRPPDAAPSAPSVLQRPLRLLMMGLLPNLAGVILAFGVALRSRPHR